VTRVAAASSIQVSRPLGMVNTRHITAYPYGTPNRAVTNDAQPHGAPWLHRPLACTKELAAVPALPGRGGAGRVHLQRGMKPRPDRSEGCGRPGN
jgi:hypothetical protein